jgi:hypothetical protein
VIENPKSQIPNSKSEESAGSRMPDPGSPPKEDYCRHLESYLCRKNDGHLIRIVGPAFEQVCGWAARGVPLKLAMRGIDRYCERYYAKGPRRRPVRIEFCEADVLDVFDEWRRSVGVSVGAGEADAAGEAGRAGEVTKAVGANDLGPRSSLPAHLERVVARLTTLRAGGDRSLDPLLDGIVRELDAARAAAKTARGDVREALTGRLQELDLSLIRTVRQQCDPPTLARLEAEAHEELSPFRARMPPDAYQQSHRACVDRLLRERAGLPVIAYE